MTFKHGVSYYLIVYVVYIKGSVNNEHICILMEGRGGEGKMCIVKKVCIKGVYLQADKPRNCSYMKERRDVVYVYN